MGTYKGGVGSSGVTLRNNPTSIGISLPANEYPVKITFDLKGGGAYWKNSSYKQSTGEFFLYSDASGSNATKFGEITLARISSNITQKEFSVSGEALKGATLFFSTKTDDPSGVGLRNYCAITVQTEGKETEEEATPEGEQQEKPQKRTIDISRIKYKVVAILSSGTKLYLENVATNIAWEENESELATRLNLTVRDVKNGGKRLYQQIALGTVIRLYYDIGEGQQEAFRGTVWEVSSSKVKDDEIVITAYDLLYYLQKSEDYGYFEAGQTTKGIISSILSEWSVPLGEYSGPSITHEKEVLKVKKISKLITEMLEKAEEKTGTKGIIRATKGKCEIVKYGTNKETWIFTADTNLLSVSDKFSMTELITKVVILGKEDKNGSKRPPVEATETGDTKYGTLQKVILVGSSTLDKAKEEAKTTIKKYGKPKRTITVVAPDCPFIRRGDRVMIVTDGIDDNFYAKTVSHNATNQQMQMECEEE